MTPSGKPVSVCLVVENLAVPTDRRVWCEARALRDAGYAVSVICPKGKKSWTSSYEVLEGVHIYRHRTWAAGSTLGYLLEYGFALLAEFYLILKVFSRTRFRILHGCNPPDTIFLLGLILKPLGVRFVFDHHDLSPELFEAKFGKASGLLSAFTRFAEKCSFKVANVSIATNESFKEIAIARGGKRPDRVFVVRNCPDLATMQRRPVRDEIKAGQAAPRGLCGLHGTAGWLGHSAGSDRSPREPRKTPGYEFRARRRRHDAPRTQSHRRP